MYKRILSICLVLQLVASSSFAEVEQSQEAEISMLSGIKYALWDLPSEATNSAISTAWYYTPSPIKTAVVYLFPFVLATVAEKNVAKPLADLIKTYSVKDTKLVKNSFFYSTVAGRALFTWATNTLNRALFGPTEAVINEAVKD